MVIEIWGREHRDTYGCSGVTWTEPAIVAGRDNDYRRCSACGELDGIVPINEKPGWTVDDEGRARFEVVKIERITDFSDDREATFKVSNIERDIFPDEFVLDRDEETTPTPPPDDCVRLRVERDRDTWPDNHRVFLLDDPLTHVTNVCLRCGFSDRCAWFVAIMGVRVPTTPDERGEGDS